jgi:pimeloyl-[acyl-carrier protein] synthase
VRAPSAPNPIVSGEADPYPRLADLRRRGPLLFCEETGIHYILGYACAVHFLRTASVSRQGYLDALIARHGENDILRAQKQELAFQDVPRHTEIKRLVMKVFTPARVQAFRPRVQQLIDAAVAHLDGDVDLLERVADPLPAHVLSELLGVPPQERTLVYAATRDLVGARGVVRTDAQIAAGSRAVQQLNALFERLCAERRRHPQDDLITDLLHAEDEGGRLEHSQLLSVLTSLYAAGFGNVRNLIGNGLAALLHFPAQLARLRQDPALLPSAVEEMLRYDSPTQATNPTMLLSDFAFEDTVVPARQLVTVHVAACNRDPAHFPDPDTFVSERKPNDHLAFSQGTHFCVGAALVRMQGELLLHALLHNFHFELHGDLTWQKLDRFRGLERLPLRLKRCPLSRPEP